MGIWKENERQVRKYKHINYEDAVIYKIGAE